MPKNNSTSKLFKDKIVQSKSSDVIRKRFLNDLSINSDKFRSNTYDNLVNQVEKNGVKKNTALYNNIKSFLYGDRKQVTLKMIKSSVDDNNIDKIFPFASDVYDSSNNAILTGEQMRFSPDINVFGYGFKDNRPQKVVFDSKDFTVTQSKFKSVAEYLYITIDKPKPEDGNIVLFMKKMIPIVNKYMSQFFTKYGSYKVVFGMNVRMYSEKLDFEDDFNFHSGFINPDSKSRVGAIVMNNNHNMKHFEKGLLEIDNEIERFQRYTSDWQVIHINKLFFKVAKYVPANGSSYIELPERISNKKCCINIQNDDNRCFEYSVLCGLHHKTIEKNLQRPGVYKPYLKTLKFEGIEFPVSIESVKDFELQNQLPINVFGLDADSNVTVLHSHTFKCEKEIINLLLIENEDKSHYVYVKNINGLFKMNRDHNYVCAKCLQSFSTKEALARHTEINRCIEFDGTAIKELPKEGKHEVEYKMVRRQLRVPFVLYADCESLLKPIEVNTSKNTQIFQNHQVNHVGVKLVSDFPHLIQDEYKQFDGPNCMIDFLNYCLDTQDKCLEIIRDETHKYYDRKSMTKDERAAYKSASHCHICTKALGEDKVLDHCHITGKYRGPAHSECNINYNYKKFKLPVIFHNLKGYDSHFIIQYAGLLNDRLKDKDIQIIPTTMEKYLSFSIDKCVFLDSCQFMNSSLESLIEALNKVYTKNNDNTTFRHFNNGFPGITSELNNLLRQKGVFPYDWFSSDAKLNETSLPNIKDFYSKLYEQDIELSEYNRAKQVWSMAGCTKFFDYLTLYLKTDVLLLADVFEAFRKMCLDKDNYGLDPCHYFTSPGFSWDAMLKMTGVTIECFKEGQDDMLEMVQKGMRGGISMISNRYAKANNKYMKSYDSTKQSSHIMYLDANNLYGWAMSQYLPTGNYRWAEASSFTTESILALSDDGETGYIFECDFHVPEDMHDYFSDYPLAPESCVGEYSPFMTELMQKYEIKQSVAVQKLIPNLYDKKNYVCHYRNLKLYLQLGLKLTHINRVLAFDQSDYLKKYIEFNTKKRAQCKNDFEKDLYKLFNNSVFGKTMENVEKRIECSLVSDSKRFLKLSSKPHFKNFKIFSEGLVACEMAKTKVIYNRPMVVGMCILDLSKVLMYDFHYNTMVKTYGNKAKLLFTDTDSLCYHIEAEDVYADMKANKELYDFCDFDDNHSIFDGMSQEEIEDFKNMNKKIQGKFKCESNGKPIVEFCGLRSKMYSFLTEAKVKCTAKGIKRNKIKQLTMDKYKAALFGTTKGELQQMVSFNSIQQKNHVVNTVNINKIGLSGLDDKRHILSDNIHTRAIGHKDNKISC